MEACTSKLVTHTDLSRLAVTNFGCHLQHLCNPVQPLCSPCAAPVHSCAVLRSPVQSCAALSSSCAAPAQLLCSPCAALCNHLQATQSIPKPQTTAHPKLVTAKRLRSVCVTSLLVHASTFFLVFNPPKKAPPQLKLNYRISDFWSAAARSSLDAPGAAPVQLCAVLCSPCAVLCNPCAAMCSPCAAPAQSCGRQNQNHGTVGAFQAAGPKTILLSALFEPEP